MGVPTRIRTRVVWGSILGSPYVGKLPNTDGIYISFGVRLREYVGTLLSINPTLSIDLSKRAGHRMWGAGGSFFGIGEFHMLSTSR